MTRRFLTTLIALSLLTLVPLTVMADHGRPHGGEDCTDRDDPCTPISAGDMTCNPSAGEANDFSVIVGSADSGEFKLEAVGVNDAANWGPCTFEIRVDPDAIRFNEGFTVGQLGPYGGASYSSYQPCVANPDERCTAVASFTWWRAAHGVTFDVPFSLWVDGIMVDEGSVHYFDPPMVDELFGGPLVLH